MSCDCRRDKSRQKKKMTELKWLSFQEKDLKGNSLKGLLVKDKVQAEIHGRFTSRKPKGSMSASMGCEGNLVMFIQTKASSSKCHLLCLFVSCMFVTT